MVIPSTLRSSRWSLFFRFFYQTYVCISLLYTLCMPCPSRDFITGVKTGEHYKSWSCPLQFLLSVRRPRTAGCGAAVMISWRIFRCCGSSTCVDTGRRRRSCWCMYLGCFVRVLRGVCGPKGENWKKGAVSSFTGMTDWAELGRVLEDNIKMNQIHGHSAVLLCLFWLSISLGGGLLLTRLWTVGWATGRRGPPGAIKPRRQKCTGHVARIPSLSLSLYHQFRLSPSRFIEVNEAFISWTFLWCWHPCKGRDRTVM